MMLMRQWQAFVLHLSLLKGPQGETRGPPQTQVALISLPSLTLMAPSALWLWTEIQGGNREHPRPFAPSCVFQGGASNSHTSPRLE